MNNDKTLVSSSFVICYARERNLCIKLILSTNRRLKKYHIHYIDEEGTQNAQSIN